MPLTEPRQSGVAPETASGPVTARLAAGSPWNVPNLITLSRLGLAVVLFWLIDGGQHWLASTVLFVVAAATDALDGWIARRYGLITKLGRVLDPFVDKVIVGGAFVFLTVHPGSGVTPWMAIIVLGREMFITSLRSFLESEGKDFSAVWSGKIKMVLQCAAVTGSLVFLGYGSGSPYERELTITRDVLLWSAIAATIYSGFTYAMRAQRLLRDNSV